MKIKLERVPLQSKQTQELIKITPQVEKVILDSGIVNGLVTVTSLHTTAGITVNEGVECVQADIISFLEKLAPEDENYRHARYLDEWGGSASNAETHLRTLVIGSSSSFPIENGKMVKGKLQTIYFVELDGPALRNFTVLVMGE
jgi:secondary thiamine-phosphate synthase enzyme